MPSFSPDSARDWESLVADLVAEVLVDRGTDPATARQLRTDRSLWSRDLTSFGLGSLDWISLATRVEAETGVELPDEALLEPRHRCVEGWSEALRQKRAGGS